MITVVQIVCSSIGGWVKPVQSFTKRARPDDIILIDIHSHEMIVRETIGIFRIMAIMCEEPSAGVEAIEPCTPGSDPNVSALVFGERADGIGPESCPITWII